jgi:hypothetical protein
LYTNWLRWIVMSERTDWPANHAAGISIDLYDALWDVVEAAREIMAVIDSGGKRSDGGDVADTLRDVLAKLEGTQR